MRNVVYPRGGWGRAAQYVKHRLQRLPDTPERISRGIAAGVFVTFTPFFGLHFLFAAIIAWATRGNILASLLGTFFGNPFTFPFIGFVSLGLGYLLLGMPFDAALFGVGKNIPHEYCGLGCQFLNAATDLWQNFKAIFTPEVVRWRGLVRFYNDVFYPYMIGGIIPGAVCGLTTYYLFVPLIGAYQNRRRKALRAKLDQLKKKSIPANEKNG